MYLMFQDFNFGDMVFEHNFFNMHKGDFAFNL